MLKESLPEFIYTANYCVSFAKDAVWGDKQVGGCLGFPAAVLLFSIANSIGSYHAGDPTFTVPLDDRQVPIKRNPEQHLFIFNAPYYGLSLSRQTLHKIYENYRCLLVHNSVLAFDHYLFKGSGTDLPFVTQDGKVHVNVSAFLTVTKRAVTEFLKVIDSIVPGSLQEHRIRSKT